MSTGTPAPLFRVVVADDSLLVREGIVRILERAGHSVVGVAADGESLRSVVAATVPDVAVVDIRMPPGIDFDELVWRVLETSLSGSDH